MVEPISLSITVALLPIFMKFFFALLKCKLSKQKLRLAMKADSEMRAEQAKERERKQALEDAAKLAKEREAAKQAKEREGRQELEEAIKQAEERAAKLAKDKKVKQVKEETVKQAIEREAEEVKVKNAKQEEGVQLDQQEVIQKLIEETRLLRDEMEREKQERKEAEKRQNKKINSLRRTLDFGIRLFKDYMLRRQSWSCHCRMHPCRCQPQILEYDERVKLLTHFDLPKDGDEVLDNIFNASYSSLQDKPNHSFDNAESSEQPNGERNPEDILNMVMTNVNDPENAQDTTLLELNYQLFEDDQESSEMIPTKNEGTQSREKGIDELPTAAAYGNRAIAYINLNKFIEAENDCTEALKIDARYFKAYARRARARTKLGCNLEGALEDARVAMELEPNNLEMKELHAELVSLKAAATEAKEEGNNFFKDQKFKDAIISYSVSINKFPTAIAYGNRAMAYLELNKSIEAENDCSKALKIDDQYFKAYARRAIARWKLGVNLEGALRDVEVALKLHPDNEGMKQLQAKLIQVFGG